MSPCGRIREGDGIKGNTERTLRRDPIQTSLLTGELISSSTAITLDRRRRSVVRVRIVGDASFGWLELAMAWGAQVEAAVFKTARVKELAQALNLQAPIYSYQEAVALPPHRAWNGLILTTILSESDQQLVSKYLTTWKPQAVMVALSGMLSRKEREELHPHLPTEYIKKSVKCTHSDFGGVTQAVWHLVFITQVLDRALRPSGMTIRSYPRPPPNGVG